MGKPPRLITSLNELDEAVRQGHILLSVKGSNPPVTAALRAEYDGRLAALPSIVDGLRKLLTGVDRFAVLGQVMAWFMESLADPPASHGVWAMLEMPAALALEHPTRAAEGCTGKGLGRAQLDRLLEGLEELLTFTPSFVIGAPGEDDDALRRLVERFVIRELNTPVVSSDQKEEQLLSEIAAGERLSAELRAVAGFDGNGALSAHRALVTRSIESLQQWSADTRDLSFDVAGCQLGDRLCFTAADLTSRGVELSTAERFCELYSQPLGSSAVTLPGMTDAIRMRPLLRDEHGKMLCVGLPLLLRILRPRLRSQLNPDDPAGSGGSVSGFRLWVRQEDRVVSAMASQAFRRAGFRATGCETKWRTAEDDSDVDVWAELEGRLLTVQIKTGRLRRWTSVKTFEADIKKLVGDAIRQHERFRLAYKRDDLTWRSRPAPPIGSELVTPIVLTLEDVSGCAVVSAHLRGAGLTDVAQLPWIVSLAHFEQAAELLDTPAALLHFLHRRTILSENQIITAIDEADLVLEYLSHGFESALSGEAQWEGASIREMWVDRPFHRYDAWLASREGTGPSAPKPSLPTPPGLEELLRRLDRDRPEGFLTMSIELLDVPRAGWDHLASAWKQVNAPFTCASARHVADPAFVFEGRGAVGFTLLRWQPQHRRRADFESVLRRHCSVQKYRAKADRWYGVMVPPTSADPLGPLLMLTTPWCEDPHEAAFAAAYLRAHRR